MNGPRWQLFCLRLAVEWIVANEEPLEMKLGQCLGLCNERVEEEAIVCLGSRGMCSFRVQDLGEPKEAHLLKELKKIWENKGFKASLPSSMGKYSLLNTLLIDDKPYEALLNPAHTAIFLAEYKVDQVDDRALGPTGELRVYLEGLSDADDVSYVKEHPFGQPEITTTHSDWDFYEKIITHFQKD